MTTRLSLFNSPLLLGFDHFERTLDRASKASADGYPPYNIEQVGSDQLRITVAVAGFTSGDLSVQTEDNQLVIRGRQTDDDKNKVYLHRGIAARQFQRSFVLADGIEVTGAWTDNGLLHVDLKRPLPEPKIRTVEIKANANSGKANRAVDVTLDRQVNDTDAEKTKGLAPLERPAE
jgi:HSP20 family molecular chaperone IbpA